MRLGNQRGPISRLSYGYSLSCNVLRINPTLKELMILAIRLVIGSSACRLKLASLAATEGLSLRQRANLRCRARELLLRRQTVRSLHLSGSSRREACADAQGSRFFKACLPCPMILMKSVPR